MVSLLCVHSLVDAEAGALTESLPTLITLKWLLGSMHPLTCTQAGTLRGSRELKLLPSVHPLVLS